MDFFLQRLSNSLNQPSFLDYFSMLLESLSVQYHINVLELVNEMNRLMKLNAQQLFAIALSCYLSSNKKTSEEGVKLLRKALEDYHTTGKVVIMPDHLLHMVLCVVRTNTEFKAIYRVYDGVFKCFLYIL